MVISGQIPTLKEFMVQRKVLKLYKDFFRATRDIQDKKLKEEVQDWIRREFKDKKNERDEFSIKLLIQSSERSLRELQSNIGLSK